MPVRPSNKRSRLTGQGRFRKVPSYPDPRRGPMPRLNINGTPLDIDAHPDTPLLWAIREQAGLTGTKYGCGIAQCGACTVHVDGAAVRSCSLPVSAFKIGRA